MKAVIAGTPLQYEVSGSGPAVLFLHAFPLTSRMWDAQARALEATHQVVRFDARGFGGTPPGDGLLTMERIADDAVAFNEAYIQAMTGQLLLNVLRARDRLPTQYLAMSAIQYAPTVTQRQALTLGNIELGDINSPFSLGSATFGRDMQLQPSFNLGPYSARDISGIIFEPEGADVFGEYWNAGWPREALLLLMADRIVRIDRPAGAAPQIHEFVNDAGDFSADCADAVVNDGCAYVREVRALTTRLRGQTPDRRTDMSGVCGLAAAYNPPRARPAAAPAAACDRGARIIVGDSEYVIFLRSLDDIVFYLGELVRTRSGEGYAAPVSVAAAGLASARVPLFRVIEGEQEGRFAASVVYEGRRYSAGPAVSRSCAAPADSGACTPDAAHGDRSSLVIALLMQLQLRNQSDGSVPPPPTVFIGRN